MDVTPYLQLWKPNFPQILQRAHITPLFKKLMLYVSVCTELHLDFKNGLHRPYRERVKVCALVMVKTPPLAKQSWIKLKSLICITKCKDFEKESCSWLPSQQSPAVHTFRWLHQMHDEVWSLDTQTILYSSGTVLTSKDTSKGSVRFFLNKLITFVQQGLDQQWQ